MDEAGRGPTQRTLAVERMKVMSGDMRDLPENYSRHPTVRRRFNDFSHFFENVKTQKSIYGMMGVIKH